jgi:hypothetical protein
MFFAYFSNRNQQLWMYEDEDKWTIHDSTHIGRRSYSFHLQSNKVRQHIPDDSVPIDVLLKTERTIITSSCFDRLTKMPIHQPTSFDEAVRKDNNGWFNNDISIVIDEDNLHQAFT